MLNEFEKAREDLEKVTAMASEMFHFERFLFPLIYHEVCPFQIW